ncbi:MAG: hypothetical protein NVSMB5_20060 [Candidatus Velthaea sp.]
MPTWTQTVSDNFTRANSATVGNGWTPITGTNWSIASNQALFTFSAGTTYQNQQLVRALSETSTGQARITFDTPALTAATNVSGTYWGAATRVQTNGDSYFCQMNGVGTLNVYKVIAGAATIIFSPPAFTPALTHAYRLDFYADGPGSGTTTLSCTVTDLFNSTIVSIATTGTDATVSLAAGGQTGLAVNINSGTLPFAAAVVYTGGALSSTLTLTDNPAGVVLSQAATSGTAPYSFSWYKSATSQATIGTLLGSTGATSTYTDAAATAAVAYYRGRVVDSAGAPATVTTAQIPGQLQPNLIIGCIGDSITNGTGASVVANCAANVLPAILSRILGNSKVTTSKNGVDGTRSGDWLGGSANLNAAITAINTAAGGQPAGSKTWITLMVGTNDSRISDQITAAVYKSNVANIIAALKAAAFTNFAGIILQKPPYINPVTNPGSICNENSDNLVQQYHPQLDALADGVQVFAGNTYAFQYFADNYTTVLFDGLHPNDAGHQGLATGWATGLNAAITPAVVAAAGLSGSRFFPGF